MKRFAAASLCLVSFLSVVLHDHGRAQTGGGMQGMSGMGSYGHPCDRLDTPAIECCPIPDPGHLPGPARFRVTNIRRGRIFLEWDGPTGTNPRPMSCALVNYRIDRSTDMINWVEIGSPREPRFTDAFQFQYTTYYYRVVSRWICENDCKEGRSYTSAATVLYASIDKIHASDASSIDNRLDYRKTPPALRDYRFGYSMYKGGLFVGFLNDPSRKSRMYTKFDVPQPPVQPTDGIWAATLEVFYLENHEDSNDYPGDPYHPPADSVTLRVHRVNDTSWLQRRIRWSDAPAYVSTPTHSIQLPAIRGGMWLEFTITPDVPAAGGPVSEAIVAQDELQRSWKYFARREYRDSLGPHILRATGRLMSD